MPRASSSSALAAWLAAGLCVLFCAQPSLAACGYSDCKNKALWTCSLHDCTSRTLIDLHDKNLWGTVPSVFGSMHTLAYALELFSNQLTGTLPPSLGSLTALNHYMGFSSNSFTGTIPSSFGSLQQLAHRLSVQLNDLTGTVPPSLGSLRMLDDGLAVTGNRLTGTIPPSLVHLTAAKDVFLSRNQLTGTLPSWFGSLSSMHDVRLDNNKLTGTLPPSLGSLTNLVSHFYVGNNFFTGLVPASLCPVLSDIAGYCDLAGDLMFLDCPLPSACAEILASKCDAECGVEPINCVGAWGMWGGCSATCDGGASRRTYSVTIPEQHGGTDCPFADDVTQSVACNTASCAGAGDVTTAAPGDDDMTIVIVASAVGGAILVAVIVALVLMSCKSKQRPRLNPRELRSVVGSGGTRPSTFVRSASKHGGDRMQSM